MRFFFRVGSLVRYWGGGTVRKYRTFGVLPRRRRAPIPHIWINSIAFIRLLCVRFFLCMLICGVGDVTFLLRWSYPGEEAGIWWRLRVCDGIIVTFVIFFFRQ